MLLEQKNNSLNYHNKWEYVLLSKGFLWFLVSALVYELKPWFSNPICLAVSLTHSTTQYVTSFTNHYLFSLVRHKSIRKATTMTPKTYDTCGSQNLINDSKIGWACNHHIQWANNCFFIRFRTRHWLSTCLLALKTKVLFSVKP